MPSNSTSPGGERVAPRRVTGRGGGTALLVLLACIPCCLPLLVIAGGALTATAGTFVASDSAWLAGVALVAGTAGTVAVLLRRRRRMPVRGLPQPLPLLDEWSPSRPDRRA